MFKTFLIKAKISRSIDILSYNEGLGHNCPNNTGGNMLSAGKNRENLVCPSQNFKMRPPSKPNAYTTLKGK